MRIAPRAPPPLYLPPSGGESAPGLIRGRGAQLVGRGLTVATPASRIPAVAMLELLTRAARAGLVTADLAPAAGIVPIAIRHLHPSVAGERRHQRRIGVGHLILAGIRVDLVRLHVGKVLLVLG